MNTRTRRLWLMRLSVAALIPAFFLGIALGLLEAGLRLTGYGYPTAYFLPQTIGERTYMEANDRFTFRFFPRALARGIVPTRVEVPKPDDTFRIVLFGESAANGDPDAAYGFGRHLEMLLQERFSDTRFEVVCAAITAINSHVILPLARDAARTEADLWIIYMGNNEVIGPYGAGTVFGRKAPPIPFIRASLAAKRTRTGQAIEAAAARLSQQNEPATWEGINLFAENLLHPSDPAKQRVYSHFERNLADILHVAQRAGVPVLLSTVASNLKDCAPFASLHPDGLAAAEKTTWQAAFERGKEHETAEAFAEALAAYTEAIAIDSQHAELLFRMGRCHENLGNLAEAHRAYTAARDADALVVRADSTINRLIREAVAKAPGSSVRLVDLVERLGPAATGEIPGHALFFEHVHFTPVGNMRVAQILAEEILPLLAPTARTSDTGEWPGPATVQRLLAVTLWDQHRLWMEMAERQTQPPFTNRFDNPATIAYAHNRAERLRETKDHPINRLIYERALEARPADYFLRARFGAWLQMNGFAEEALPHLAWVAETYPDFIGAHQDLGVALFLLQRFPEARASFERALALNPDYPRARTALALIEQQDPAN